MKNYVRVATGLAAILFVCFSSAVLAQHDNETKPVAKAVDMYCTGFIAAVSPRTDLQVVGGEKENEVQTFSQGDVVYLNQGRENGVHPGAVFEVLRPMGHVKHPFTKKDLGYFVRDIGRLRVLESHAKTATAEIILSCDSVELGDVLRTYETKVGPGHADRGPLPRYSEGAGGLTGQIVMSPASKEYLSANQVVFIDLGDKQGVQPGDQFTIYRKITRREGVANMPNDKIVEKRNEGYGSKRFKGTVLSQSSPRVSRSDVMDSRPELPRKVMGDLVVLKVEKTVAAALITRTVAEVNIGDLVEKNNY
jgi:hypothetical protein